MLGGYAACMVAAGAILQLITQRGYGHDFARPDLVAYIEAARRLVSGEPLYPQLAAGSYTLGERNLYLYPPPVALLFVPALVLPLDVAITVWGIFLTALAVGTALGIARGVESERRPLAVALFLGAFPLHWELGWGNLTLVTLSLALGAYAMRGSAVGSASLLALAAGMKLLVIPLFIALAVGGRWRVVVASVAVLASIGALSWPLIGPLWVDWARLALQLASGPPTTSYNIVPEALRSGGGRVLLLSATLAALAACGMSLRTGRLPAHLALAAALAGAPYLSPFVWYSYALFTLPIVVLLALGDVPTWPRAAVFGGWILLQLQAFDPTTAFPSALLATGIVISSAIFWGQGGRISRARGLPQA